jgi:geranylgeranyl diphosphate synthase type II
MQPAALKIVEATLEEYGALTGSTLRAYLASAGEPRRRYLYDLIAGYPLRAGKMMRRSLCIANARIFGADPANALSTALAVELLHNALLIHDDIEDGSERHRGRPGAALYAWNSAGLKRRRSSATDGCSAADAESAGTG